MPVYQIQFLTGTCPVYSQTQIPLINPMSGVLPDGSNIYVYYLAGNVPIYKASIKPNREVYGVTGSVSYNIGCGNNTIPVQFFPVNASKEQFEISFTIPNCRLGNPVFITINIQEE
jgi:hypothetical protein